MRALGTALLLVSLQLAGCGGDAPRDAGANPSPSGEPSMSIGDPVQEPTVVAVISEPGAGGEVTETPVAVGDAAALDDFVDQFDGQMRREVTQAAAGAVVPDGQTLLAAVVDVSCNPPQGVRVKVKDGGVRVVPVMDKKDGGVICFLEITTVAIVTAVV